MVIGLDPGIMVSSPDLTPEQRLDRVLIDCPQGGPGADRFGKLAPAAVSEVLADLTTVTTAT